MFSLLLTLLLAGSWWDGPAGAMVTPQSAQLPVPSSFRCAIGMALSGSSTVAEDLSGTAAEESPCAAADHLSGLLFIHLLTRQFFSPGRCRQGANAYLFASYRPVLAIGTKSGSVLGAHTFSPGFGSGNPPSRTHQSRSVSLSVTVKRGSRSRTAAATVHCSSARSTSQKLSLPLNS